MDNKKKKIKGFTLIELLAVIVILAIILIIAVPKIMSTINQSKTSSMESSAKLAAKAVERAYEVSLANGEEGTLDRKGDCMEIANLDTKEYKSCTYEIDENEKAIVTIKGTSTGKFANLQVKNATTKTATTEAVVLVTLENTIKNLVGAEAGVTFSEGGLKKYTYDSTNTEATENITKTDYRYYGSNPNNYIKFSGSDEVWRIIGIVDGKVKVIREESFKKTDNTLLTMSWDSSASTVNSGYGINEWSQADIMTMLNNYYYGTSNTCTYCNNWKQETCTNDCATGTTYIAQMPNAIKNMIDANATWYIASANTGDSDWETIKAADAYKNERGEGTGKICSSGSYCTDTITRTTTWTGAVGLMSLSDYGYASDLSQCTNALLGTDWVGYSATECKNTNWLYQGHTSENQWTVSPSADSSDAGFVWPVYASGYASSGYAYDARAVRGAAYLKSSVSVESGTGTVSDPYILIN